MGVKTLLPGLATLAVLGFATPVFADIGQFTGTWQNVNTNDRGVIRIAVTAAANAVRVQVWGNCTPTPCDWGQVAATPYGADVGATLPQQATVLRAEYIQGFARRQVIIHPAGNQLRVEVLTQFTDNSNRSNYADIDLFNRTVGPLSEDCVTFDPKSAQAAQVQGRWKLIDGSHWILDFGSNQAEAQRADQIVKHYDFSKLCFVGRPDPSFTYWLARGQSATGSLAGEDCVGFNPTTVAVSSAGGLWRMVDGSHAMFSFPNQSEAEKALQIVKHYGFNQSCFVGRPNPSMSYQRK
jgi:hypothetical protein